MVESIGLPMFERAFFSFFCHVLDIEQTTVFEFPRNAAPKTIIATGRSERSDRLAKSSAEEYTDGEFIKGPNLWNIKTLAPSEIEIHNFELNDFSDKTFRSRFYIQNHLGHELALLFTDEQRLLYISFYRLDSQLSFDDKDKKQLAHYAKLCLSFLQRHIELWQNKISEVKTIRDIRFQRVYDILMQNHLSPREAEICACIVIGYTTQGIGLDLGISENTVGTHRKRAYAKLGISTQNEIFGICFDTVIRHTNQLDEMMTAEQ